MNAQRRVIITTRLPPAACGIGTYSWLLRAADDSDAVEFLVIDGAADTKLTLAGDAVTDFGNEGRRLTAALTRIGSADVLLHFAGRAYHHLGFPRWMPRVLADWKRKFPDARLLIFFHEVPGKLSVTSRHYWLGLLNAHVIRQLAKLADVVVTNTETHVAQLGRISGRGDVRFLPVGSNIESVRDREDRVPTEFVLFGLPFGRLQTLQMFEPHIRRWLEQGVLTKLHIIGPPDEKFTAQANELLDRLPNANIAAVHGLLPSIEVAKLLGRARYALTNATADTWSKSGAFMAAAANGCAVVTRETPPPLVPLTYASSAEEIGEIAADEVQRRATALRLWYLQNSDWPVIAQKLASFWNGAEERS